MADALSWSGQYLRTRAAGMVEHHRAREATDPAPTITSKARSDSWLRMGNQAGSTVRHIDEPAPAVLFGHRSNRVTWEAEPPPARIRTQNFTARDHRGQCGERYERDTDRPSPTMTGQSRLAEWVFDRPATTVQGDPRIGRPGHKDRDGGEAQFATGSVRVSVTEAGVLQSFPADYPWRGSRTAQFGQVGNAVPPLLAAHVLAALGVGDQRPWEDS